MESQNKILKSLADLESNLISIQSASEMVKDSVSKNKEVFTHLSEYTNILGQINSNFSEVVNESKLLQEKINTNIDKSVDRVCDITDKLETSLADLQIGVQQELNKIEESGNETIEHFSKLLAKLSEDSKSEIRIITNQCIADNSTYVKDAIDNYSLEQKTIFNTEFSKLLKTSNELLILKNDLIEKLSNNCDFLKEIKNDEQANFNNLVNVHFKNIANDIENSVNLLKIINNELTLYKEIFNDKNIDLQENISYIRDLLNKLSEVENQNFNDLLNVHLKSLNSKLESNENLINTAINELSNQKNIQENLLNQITFLHKSNKEILTCLSDIDVNQKNSEYHGKTLLKINISTLVILFVMIIMFFIKL